MSDDNIFRVLDDLIKAVAVLEQRVKDLETRPVPFDPNQLCGPEPFRYEVTDSDEEAMRLSLGIQPGTVVDEPKDTPS